MRILITGSRDWTDWHIIHAAIETEVYNARFERNTPIIEEGVTVVHGGAIGADSLAGRIARNIGFDVEVHPADWKNWGRRAGMIRNIQMIREGADVCLAFIKDESKGATMTAENAEKAGIPTKIFREKTDDR